MGPAKVSASPKPTTSATAIVLITVACLIFLAAAIYALSYLFRNILAKRLDSHDSTAPNDVVKAKAILEEQIRNATGLDRIGLLEVLRELEQRRPRARSEMRQVRRGGEDVEAGDIGLARGPSTPLTGWNLPCMPEPAHFEGARGSVSSSTLSSWVREPVSGSRPAYLDGSPYPSSTALPSALRRASSRHTMGESTHADDKKPNNRSTGDLSFTSSEPSLEPECYGWRQSRPTYEQWHRELALETLEGRVPWYDSDHAREQCKLDDRTPRDLRRLAGKRSVSEQKRDWLKDQLKGVGESMEGRSSLMSAVLRASDVAVE